MLALLRVYRAKIKPTCGLHIHINVKSLLDKQILNIIREFIHRQKYIAKRFKVSKERLENTCKLIPKSELHHLTEKQIHAYRNKENFNFNNFKYLDDKYHSLNASHMSKGDYSTLEFRLFSGTLNFREIKERIYWTLNFIKDSCERE